MNAGQYFPRWRFKMRDANSGDLVTVTVAAPDVAAAVARLRLLLAAATVKARQEQELQRLLLPVGRAIGGP